MVVPVPTPTKPPVMVMDRPPTVVPRSNVDVDVDHWTWFWFPPANSFGFIVVVGRREVVLGAKFAQKRWCSGVRAWISKQTRGLRFGSSVCLEAGGILILIRSNRLEPIGGYSAWSIRLLF